MKITNIIGYELKLPKISTTIVGGRDEYEGIPYRDEPLEEMESYVGAIPHFGFILSHLVAVHTDEGIIGYGEAENGLRDDFYKLRENLLGMDVYDVQHIMNRRINGYADTIRNKAPHKSLLFTKDCAAIEFALWDIMGKKAGLPVYKLLGGKVREKNAITLFVGQKAIDHQLADIERAVSEGIKAIKVKVGSNDAHDMDLLKEIRRQFGWELIIRIDPNRAWTVTDGARILRRMADYSIQYIEGALRRIESYGFKRLRELCGIPICICEQFNGPYVMSTEQALVRVQDLIRMEAFDVLSVDPSRTGGLLGFGKICAACEGIGAQVVTHRARAGVSQSVWLNAVITSQAASYAHDIVPVGQPSGADDDIITTPLRHENGYMTPPDGPGLGVEVDMEKVRKYCVREL